MRTLKELHPQHIEIIRAIADGKTDKEIAASMGYTTSSIETIRVTIRRHAGARSSAQLVSWAYQRGILQLQQTAA